MKSKNILWLFLTIVMLCFAGCFSSGTKQPDPIPVRYSFAESGEKAVPITFIQGNKVGVMLVDCNGVPRPTPSPGTYWERDSLFPVGKPLDLRVYVYWNENRFGERRKGIFKCPPLEAGREYKLWFTGNSKGGKLILTYSNVASVNGTSKADIVYEQAVPPPPK
ncbi:hypothetical protein [Treponema sp. R6D11]